MLYVSIASLTPAKLHSSRTVPEWVDGKPPYRLRFSNEAYLFPAAALNSTSHRVVLLSNTGFQPIEVSSVSITSAFTCFTGAYASPFLIQPGEQKELSVTFAPEVAGSFTGSLVVASSNHPTITLPIYGEAYGT